MDTGRRLSRNSRPKEEQTAAPVSPTRHLFRPGTSTRGIGQDGISPDSAMSRRHAVPVHGMTTAEALLRGLRLAGVSTLPVDSIPLHLLIVESDAALLTPLMEIGREMGFFVQGGTPAEIARDLGSVPCDVVLLDLAPTAPSLDLLRTIRHDFPRVPILVTTAFASVQTAVDALRLGATDFLTKPYSLAELTTMLHAVAEQRSFDLELRRVQHLMRSSPALQEVAAASPAMQKLLGMVTRVAQSHYPVMILGETGSGKERVARMLHAAGHAGAPSSASEPAPFLHVRCSTESMAVVETELFGFVRNEGTSLREEEVGHLTADSGGTLFLDEVDALSLEMQAKLLRALQQKSVRPPGSAMTRPLTVRVVAASSRDLPALVERGLFRKDLYYRLNVVNLRVPPLRDRRADIPLLAAVFLERHSQNRNLNFSLGADAMRVLMAYDWPGNVSELEAVIERACSLSSGPVLHEKDLPSQMQQVTREADRTIRFTGKEESGLPEPGTVAFESIADMERRAILGVLEKLNGDKQQAAKVLGIGKTTLYRKLKEYGIAEM